MTINTRRLAINILLYTQLCELALKVLNVFLAPTAQCLPFQWRFVLHFDLNIALTNGFRRFLHRENAWGEAKIDQCAIVLRLTIQQ
ncbi:hypothetical protein XENTR_v10008486 [Xenopus tropicalis]|nr:hypothetical protein XENTR_v10008486 [Xenopus tropicalis]